MSGYESLVEALREGWVTRSEVQQYMSLADDRVGRGIVCRLKKEFPVVFGTSDRPGYHISKQDADELPDINRCIYHYENMIMDMRKSLEQLKIARDKIMYPEG